MVLPSTTHLGAFTLTVASLDRSIHFYQQVIGMRLLSTETGRAILGVDTPLLILKEKPGATRQPARSTGLYHAAILLPTRADLARTILPLAQIQYPLQGYSDHRVSEAFYLADPDGNGLELYRDKPRDEWVFVDGKLNMGNDPIDLDDFFAEAGDDSVPYSGLPAGTRIGHMHLRVGNADQAVQFYTQVIGFETMQLWHGAGFVSAGGYHHHLGLNMWSSQGAGAPPLTSVGLEEWTVIVPEADAIDAVVRQAEKANANWERDGEDLIIRDPWGTPLRIVVQTTHQG